MPSGMRPWVFAVLLAAGCNVGPKFVKPEVKLNDKWSGAGDPRFAPHGEIDRAWWKSFHDATLDRLVEAAYQQNLPLQIAGLRIMEARAQLGLARAQQYPTNPGPIGSAQLNGLHNDAANIVAGNFQVGFDAVWEVDLWGKLRKNVRAAKATYFSTVADYDGAMVSLTAEVARTYALIRTFEVLIDLAQGNVSTQEEGQHLAESRFRNGATSELDPSQATYLLEATRATIPELQVSLVQAQNALCTLLGRPTGCAESQLPGPHAIPAVQTQVIVSVPVELLRRRADIRAAELRAVAQCDRIGVAKAEFFPKLALFGSVGTQNITSTGVPGALAGIANLFSPGTLVYTVGANLFFPLLFYPQIMNNVRVQDARLQQLLVEYQNTVLKAAQEVEDGMTGFLREQDAAVFAQNGVTAAQNAVRLSLVQYREGATDYQRVVDSQKALVEAQNNLARMRSASTTNLIALYKALGGGWELRQNDPVVRDTARDEMRKRTNWGSYLDKPQPTPIGR